MHWKSSPPVPTAQSLQLSRRRCLDVGCFVNKLWMCPLDWRNNILLELEGDWSFAIWPRGLAKSENVGFSSAELLMLETQHITTILASIGLDAGTSLCTSHEKINDLRIQQSEWAGKVFLALHPFGRQRTCTAITAQLWYVLNGLSNLHKVVIHSLCTKEIVRLTEF